MPVGPVPHLDRAVPGQDDDPLAVDRQAVFGPAALPGRQDSHPGGASGSSPPGRRRAGPGPVVVGRLVHQDRPAVPAGPDAVARGDRDRRLRRGGRGTRVGREGEPVEPPGLAVLRLHDGERPLAVAGQERLLEPVPRRAGRDRPLLRGESLVVAVRVLVAREGLHQEDVVVEKRQATSTPSARQRRSKTDPWLACVRTS